jgi:uncharacterized membrane protein
MVADFMETAGSCHAFLESHIFRSSSIWPVLYAMGREACFMENRPVARFWEVDFLRGAAIVLMVIYHFIFDLDYFQVYETDPSSGFLSAAARITVTLFLLLVGISLTLSHSRSRLLGQEALFLPRLARRSAWIMSLALGITAVTYLFVGRGFIIFGVLHLIGLSLLMAYPFLHKPRADFIVGLSIILAGISLPGISIDPPWLIPLGLAPPDFCSLDYVPIFPWFGVVLVGMGLGDVLYPNYRRRMKLPDLSGTGSPAVKLLALLGRNSLAIYLIHQPVLVTLFYLAGVPITWQ